MKKMLVLLLAVISIYCPAQTVQEVPVKTSYGIGSSFLIGFNWGVTLVNITNIAQDPKLLAYTGIVTGAADVILGLANIKKDKIVIINRTITWGSTYHAQNNLSYINIGIGTATLVTSLVNLALNTRPKNKKTALNVYANPGINNMLNAGLVLTRRI